WPVGPGSRRARGCRRSPPRTSSSRLSPESLELVADAARCAWTEEQGGAAQLPASASFRRDRGPAAMPHGRGPGRRARQPYSPAVTSSASLALLSRTSGASPSAQAFLAAALRVRAARKRPLLSLKGTGHAHSHLVRSIHRLVLPSRRRSVARRSG